MRETTTRNGNSFLCVHLCLPAMLLLSACAIAPVESAQASRDNAIRAALERPRTARVNMRAPETPGDLIASLAIVEMDEHGADTLLDLWKYPRDTPVVSTAPVGEIAMWFALHPVYRGGRVLARDELLMQPGDRVTTNLLHDELYIADEAPFHDGLVEQLIEGVELKWSIRKADDGFTIAGEFRSALVNRPFPKFYSGTSPVGGITHHMPELYLESGTFHVFCNEGRTVAIPCGRVKWHDTTRLRLLFIDVTPAIGLARPASEKTSGLDFRQD